ncbi:hypothetical protein LA080_002155 [Diaporthe eres]|nr:hypothetical protein LA080_002155 [Diaporthe eres]
MSPWPEPIFNNWRLTGARLAQSVERICEETRALTAARFINFLYQVAARGGQYKLGLGSATGEDQTTECCDVLANSTARLHMSGASGLMLGAADWPSVQPSVSNAACSKTKILEQHGPYILAPYLHSGATRSAGMCPDSSQRPRVFVPRLWTPPDDPDKPPFPYITGFTTQIHRHMPPPPFGEPNYGPGPRPHLSMEYMRSMP